MSVPPSMVLSAAGLAVASFTDVRTGRIYNALTFPMMVLGVGLHVITGDPVAGGLGLLVATALHVPVWMLGVQRAGDAKLIMALGALGGWRTAVEVSLWYAIVYLPAGLAVLAMSGQLGNLKRTALFVFHKALAQAQGQKLSGEPPPPTMLKTAPIIAVAWALAATTTWLESVF